MRLFWLDLEMSGLHVETCRILEAAAVVTDLRFRELETYEAIVRQPPDVLSAMDEWCTRQHGQSGLTAAVPHGKPEQEVELELLEMVNRHWKAKERAVLCGNSIASDRAFVQRYWPKLASRLHYRMVDVSSWKVIFRERFGVKYEKSEKHRAIGDIRESIAELRHYLGFLDLTRVPASS